MRHYSRYTLYSKKPVGRQGVNGEMMRCKDLKARGRGTGGGGGLLVISIPSKLLNARTIDGDRPGI